MTLDEARQLKPGDRVLVEATIREINNHMPEDGNIYIALNVVNLEHDEAWSCVRCEDIREKIAPPRRKFKKGDIVIGKDGEVRFVFEDECDGRLYISDNEFDSCMEYDEPCNVTLICAVEDRRDRKEEA